MVDSSLPKSGSFRQAVVDVQRVSARQEHVIAALTIAVPAIGAAVVLTAAAFGYVRAAGVELAVTLAFCLVTQVGITVGFHRLFTHRAFVAHPMIRFVLGICGSMAAQGPLLFWVAEHRQHHQRSDVSGDPHSPYVSGPRRLSRIQGFWHAHIGWMFEHESQAWKSHARDIFGDPASLFLTQWYPAWVFLGMLLPGLICGLLRGSLRHFFLGVLWGGIVRIFIVHHATWSVNSLGHMIGRRTFKTRDYSRNNSFVALITLGEGWHNNHHAFPSSARHGLEWWQLDLSYCFILMMRKFKLASNIKIPSAQQIERSKQSHSCDDQSANQLARGTTGASQ